MALRSAVARARELPKDLGVAALVNSAVGPYLLFALATVSTLGLLGYHFGTFDQIISLPFLRHVADPTLYGSDPFLALSTQRYTFFFWLFVPFLRWGWLESAFLAAHVLSIYLSFWAVWSLSQALFANRAVSALAVVGLIVPHGVVGALSFVEYSLLYRGVVLPFILWALALFVRRRAVAAFALLGFLYNFHVISVNLAFGLLLVAAVGQLRQLGGWLSLRRLGVGLAAFVVGALPVLAWRASAGGLDLSVRPDWLAVMALVGPGNLMALSGPNPWRLLFALSDCSMVVMFGVAWRAGPHTPRDRTGGLFMLAALLILAGSQALYYLWPLTGIVQLQWVRVNALMLLLARLYFARYLLQPGTSPLLGRARAVVVAAYIFMPLPFLPLLVLALIRWSKAARWGLALAGFLTVSLPVAALIGSIASGFVKPGIGLGVPRDDWTAAQAWARQHTPRDAQFITPPQLGGLYQAGWRYTSERGTVVTLIDLWDVAYSPDYLAVWQPRFEALAPGALARFDGNEAANATFTEQAFYSLTEAQLLAAARQYGASYLVTARPRLHPWPVAYQNTTYVIYDLRSVE